MDSSNNSSSSPLNNHDLLFKGSQSKADNKNVNEIIEYLQNELKNANQFGLLQVDQQIRQGIQLIYLNIFSIGYILTKNQQTNLKFYFAENAIQIGLNIQPLLNRYILVEVMYLILFIFTQQAKQTMSQVLVKKSFQFIQQNQEILKLECTKLEKISKKLNKLKKIINQKAKEEKSKNFSQLFDKIQADSNKDFLQKFGQIDQDQNEKLLLNFDNSNKTSQITSDQCENQINQKSQLIKSFCKLKQKRTFLINNHLENNEFDQINRTSASIKSSRELRKCISLSIKENDLLNDSIKKQQNQNMRTSVDNIQYNSDQPYYVKVDQLQKTSGKREPQTSNEKVFNRKANQIKRNIHQDQSGFRSQGSLQQIKDENNQKNIRQEHKSQFDINSLLEFELQNTSLERNESKDHKQLHNNKNNNYYQLLKLNKKDSEKNKKSQENKINIQNYNALNYQIKFINQKEENVSSSQLQNLVERVKEATKSKLNLQKRTSEYSSLNNTSQTYKTQSEIESTFPIKKYKQVSTQLQYPTQTTIPCSSQSSLSKIQPNKYSGCYQKIESCSKIKVFDDYQLSNEGSTLNYKRQKFRNSSEVFCQNKTPQTKPIELQYLSETDVQSLQEKSDGLISPTTIVSPLSQTSRLSQKNCNRRHVKFFSQTNQDYKKFLKFDDQSKGINDDKAKQQKINIFKKQDTSIQVSQLSSEYNLSKQDSNQSNQTHNNLNNLHSNSSLNYIELSTRPQIKNNLIIKHQQKEQKQDKLNQILQLNEQNSIFLKKQPYSSCVSSRNSSQTDKEIKQYLFWKDVISNSIERDIQQSNLNKNQSQNDNNNNNQRDTCINSLPSQINFQLFNKKPSIKEILQNRMKKIGESLQDTNQFNRDSKQVISQEKNNQSQQRINKNNKENIHEFKNLGTQITNQSKADNINKDNNKIIPHSRCYSNNFIDDLNTSLEQIQGLLIEKTINQKNQKNKSNQSSTKYPSSPLIKRKSQEVVEEQEQQKSKVFVNKFYDSKDSSCMLQNIKNNLKIFSQMDKYKNMIETKLQSEIKEINESQVISLSNISIDRPESQNKFNEEIALSQKKSQFNQNQIASDFLEDSCFNQQIKSGQSEQGSENSSFFKLSEYTLLNSDFQDKESPNNNNNNNNFNNSQQFQEKKQIQNKFSLNLSPHQKNSLKHQFFKKFNEQKINNIDLDNISSQQPKINVQGDKMIKHSQGDNTNEQSKENSFKLKLQLCEQQVNKKNNLVEQLQINYNINSKEFLKKTILNNIQKKYQLNKNKNEENNSNQVLTSRTDAEYSLNLLSSFVDQAQQNQDKTPNNKNRTNSINNDTQQKDKSESDLDNQSQKCASSQQDDNCSMIKFHHSLVNSMIMSEKINDQSTKANQRKSKYFQQIQNNQTQSTPKQPNDITNDQEQNDKENTNNYSPNMHTTKYTFQSHRYYEEEYQNGLLFMNSNNKKPQSKKLKRLNSFCDILTAQREHPEKFQQTKQTSEFQKQGDQIFKIDLQKIVENRNDRSSSCFFSSEYNTPSNNNKKNQEISIIKSPFSPLASLNSQNQHSSSNLKSQVSQFFQKYQNLQPKDHQNNQYNTQILSALSKPSKPYLQLLKPNIQFSSLFQNQKIFIDCQAEINEKLCQIIIVLKTNQKLSLRYSIEYSPEQIVEDIQSPHHSQSQTIWPLLSEYFERDLLKKYGILIQQDFNNLKKLQNFNLQITDNGSIIFTKDEEKHQKLNQSDKLGVIGINNIVDSLFKHKNMVKIKQKLVGKILCIGSNVLHQETINTFKKMKSVNQNTHKKQIYNSQEKIKDKKSETENVKCTQQNLYEILPTQFYIIKKNKLFYIVELNFELQLDASKQVYKEDQINLLIRIYSPNENMVINEKKLPIKSLQLIDVNIILSIISRIKHNRQLVRYQKEYLRQYLQLYLQVSDDLVKLDLKEDIYLPAIYQYQTNEWIDQDQFELNQLEFQKEFDDKGDNFKFEIFNNTFNQLTKQFYHEKISLNLNGKITYQGNNEQLDAFQSQQAIQKQPIIEAEEEFNLNDFVKYRRTGLRSANYQKDLVNIQNYLKDKILYLKFSAQNFVKLNYRIVFILNKSLNPKTNKIFTQLIMKKFSSYTNETLLVYKTNCKRAIQLFNLAYTQKSYQKKMNLHSLIYKNQTNSTFFLSHSQNRNLSYHLSKFYKSPVYFQPLPRTHILKVMLLKNQPELKSFFFHRQMLFLEKTENLGKITVKVDIYQNYDNLFITFTLNDYQKRTKANNLILSKQDIEMILSRPLAEDVRYIRKELLIKISQIIIQKMYLQQNFVNKTLKILVEGKSYKNNFDQSQYFNSIKKQVEIKSSLNVAKNFQFLQKEQKIERTIFHQIVIKNDQYCIATIQRHLHFDAFIFNIYFPKSSRKIRAYLTLSELRELNKQDMISIMREILQRLSIAENKHFSFQDYLSNSLKSQNSKLLSKPSFNFESCFQSTALKLSKLEYKVSKEIKEFDKFSKERNRNIQNLYNPQSQKYRIKREKLERFKEIRIWEKILGLIQVVEKGDQYFLEIGSSAVIPTNEYLNTQSFKIDSTNDSYFAEYYLSSRISSVNTNSSIGNNSPYISYGNQEDYDIFIRFYQLGQEKFIQKRLNVRDLLNLQVADGLFKDLANFSQTKIMLCDFRQMTNFISYKISNLDFPEIQSHLPFQRNFNQQKYSSQLLNKRNAMRKLVCFVVDEDKQYLDKQAQESTSFTQIICASPQIIVTYSFSSGENQLRICIYVSKSGQQYYSQIYFTELEEKIPFFQVYYNSNMFKKLFSYITVLYKQQILDILNQFL